jgi:hypothetical protein
MSDLYTAHDEPRNASVDRSRDSAIPLCEKKVICQTVFATSRRFRLLMLVAAIGPLWACGAERVSGPISPRAGAEAMAATIVRQHPGALTRTMRLRAGPLTGAQARGRLGTPTTHPQLWGGFQAKPANLAASSRSRANVRGASAIESLVYDTLFGGLQLDIGGTRAELYVGSRATENGSVVANISAWAYPTLHVGMLVPPNMSAVHCGSMGFFCDTGWVWEGVDCETPNGSRIEANSDHGVTYLNGNSTSGSINRSKACFPSDDGSGGDDDGEHCDTYIIEMSVDGGASWTEIGRYTECT